MEYFSSLCKTAKQTPSYPKDVAETSETSDKTSNSKVNNETLRLNMSSLVLNTLINNQYIYIYMCIQSIHGL